MSFKRYGQKLKDGTYVNWRKKRKLDRREKRKNYISGKEK